MYFNCDCIEGAKEFIPSEYLDVLICDPPFGIQETSFHKHYKRKEEHVLAGYVEAPSDYYKFSCEWIEQAKRVLKPDGSLYIVSGWTHLKDILNAIDVVGLEMINHIIWKFNFGVATQKKYVTSHYHILYLKKPGSNPKFNTWCRFGFDERDEKNGSLQYQDIEDVWLINKEFQPGQTKNKNKLPDALVAKMIQYSSDPGDKVGDFFLGNFTTAAVAKRLGRKPVGFEINPESFNYGLDQLNQIVSGCDLESLKKVTSFPPENRGKPVTAEETELIKKFYEEHCSNNTKKWIIEELCKKTKRGRFSILNILEKIKSAS